MTIRTSYLKEIYNVSSFTETVNATVRLARKLKREIPFDTIAFTGNSGSALAYILSMKLAVPLICIRKEDSNNHYTHMYGNLEGNVSAKKYIIIDDFISSGATVEKIQNAIADCIPKAKCVAILLYSKKSSRYFLKESCGGVPIYSRKR